MLIICLQPVASARAADPEPAPDTPPPAESPPTYVPPPTYESPPDDELLPRKSPQRFDLIPYFDIGFGLPTGVLGLSIEGRYGPVGLEVGGGFGLGGWQGMVQGWAHLFRTEAEADLALGIGYSTGDVQSRGDLGGLLGPESRYKPAHWLNVMVAPTLKPMANGEGVVIRLHLGAMINLAPKPSDSARVLPIVGLSFGWDIPL